MSDVFCEKHKKNPKDFTRNRLLPFHNLIYFLLNMNNGSYQNELDNFYKTIFQYDIPQRILFKGSLTKARKKLDHEAFEDINDHMVNEFYDYFNYLQWHGFNLLAVDGTTLRVPDEKPIVEHFGAWTTNQGDDRCPMARGSQMFDVLNKITVDAILSPKEEGERELAAYHFLKLQPNDLVLLDRGYPAYWIFQAILSSKAQFCARVPYKQWKIIHKFYKSGKAEKIVRLHPSAASKKTCKEMGFDTKAIAVRLIRVELESGETEILVTSLTDIKGFSKELFSELYFSRWPIEEDYKTLKYRMQIENFSGKSVHSVYQDFHAKLVSKNLTAIIATTTREEIIKKSETLKFQHKINFAQALSKMKNTIVLLFNCTHDLLLSYIEQIRTIFIQSTESVRPGRQYPRKHRAKRKRFDLNYKPSC